MPAEYTRNLITTLTNKQPVTDPTPTATYSNVTSPVGLGVPCNYILPYLHEIQQKQQQQQKVQSELPKQQFGTYKKKPQGSSIKTVMKVPLKKHQKTELDAVKDLFR